MTLRKDVFTVTSKVLDICVPRCFGLLPLRYKSNTERLVPSRLWLIVSNLCGLLFIASYPFAKIEIYKNRTVRSLSEESGFIRHMLIAQYIIFYVLSSGIFIRQMWFSKHQMHTLNRNREFYRQCERLNAKKVDVSEFIYPFIFHGFSSYFGYALLNYLAMFHFYGDLLHVNFFYKFLFFMPNIVITTTTMRFHSGVMQLTICGRRLNEAFSRCIRSVNEANNKSMAELELVCASAIERFEYLTMLHAEWYDIARMLEKELSLQMLFTVTNAFTNLTSAVNTLIYRHLLSACKRFIWF